MISGLGPNTFNIAAREIWRWSCLSSVLEAAAFVDTVENCLAGTACTSCRADSSHNHRHGAACVPSSVDPVSASSCVLLCFSWTGLMQQVTNNAYDMIPCPRPPAPPPRSHYILADTKGKQNMNHFNSV